MQADQHALPYPDIQAEIARSQDSIRLLTDAHPRAAKTSLRADGITTLELGDDARRAVATIRYHRDRIQRLQALLDQIDHTGARAAKGVA